MTLMTRRGRVYYFYYCSWTDRKNGKEEDSRPQEQKHWLFPSSFGYLLQKKEQQSKVLHNLHISAKNTIARGQKGNVSFWLSIWPADKKLCPAELLFWILCVSTGMCPKGNGGETMTVFHTKFMFWTTGDHETKTLCLQNFYHRKHSCIIFDVVQISITKSSSGLKNTAAMLCLAVCAILRYVNDGAKQQQGECNFVNHAGKQKSFTFHHHRNIKISLRQSSRLLPTAYTQVYWNWAELFKLFNLPWARDTCALIMLVQVHKRNFASMCSY